MWVSLVLSVTPSFWPISVLKRPLETSWATRSSEGVNEIEASSSDIISEPLEVSFLIGLCAETERVTTILVGLCIE